MIAIIHQSIIWGLFCLGFTILVSMCAGVFALAVAAGVPKCILSSSDCNLPAVIRPSGMSVIIQLTFKNNKNVYSRIRAHLDKMRSRVLYEWDGTLRISESINAMTSRQTVSVLCTKERYENENADMEE